ncbi:MAG: hypothetical protein HZB35_10015 [Nitrospirae bacterium]|nr:hypothetical protein [Nitrospirota bacterium]
MHQDHHRPQDPGEQVHLKPSLRPSRLIADAFLHRVDEHQQHDQEARPSEQMPLLRVAECVPAPQAQDHFDQEGSPDDKDESGRHKHRALGEPGHD